MQNTSSDKKSRLAQARMINLKNTPYTHRQKRAGHFCSFLMASSIDFTPSTSPILALPPVQSTTIGHFTDFTFLCITSPRCSASTSEFEVAPEVVG